MLLMQIRPVLFSFFVLVAACGKVTPPEKPEVGPPVETGPAEFALYVHYKPPVHVMGIYGSFPEDIPFDENDQMLVTGEGVRGTLTLDRHYFYPGGYVFTGHLDYEGEGTPPDDLALEVRRINPTYSNDGTELPELAVGDDLVDAVNRYGIYRGTCSYGNPIVELSLSNSFIEVFLYGQTPFPATWNGKVRLFNGGKAFGPFSPARNEGYDSLNPVLVLPEGTILQDLFMELDGIAKFPVFPSFLDMQDGAVLDGGTYYVAEIMLHDLARLPGYGSGDIVFYQSDPRRTYNNIFVGSTSSAEHTIVLSHVNIESGEIPVTLGMNTSLWVDGDCKVVSTEGSFPAISAVSPYSLRIQGDGTLVAENVGKGKGGAGISFGGYSSLGKNLVIEGSVNVRTTGAEGAPGIGIGWLPAYYNQAPYAGTILVNTTGMVTATGGKGAPGIGIGWIEPMENPFLVSFGGITVRGGLVNATGNGGEADDDIPDIGVPEVVDISESILVDPSVTYDGVHGYHVCLTKDGVPFGYRKNL